MGGFIIKLKYIAVFIVLSLLFIVNYSLESNSLPKKKEITAEGLKVRKYLGLDEERFKKFTGKNTVIAILDTGIEISENISNERVIAFKDFVNNKIEPYDDNGHGTSIAAIISSDGNFQGIAPKSSIIALKILDQYGNGNTDALFRALAWISKFGVAYNINIVNISAGINMYGDESEKLENLLIELNKKGILVVCAAGNKGLGKDTILYPGVSENVITIGSVKNNETYSIKDDKVTSFSSRENETKIKPDLYTLGVDISTIDRNNNHITKSGTSFSNAIATGAFAVLHESVYYENLTFLELLDKFLFKQEYEKDNLPMFHFF